MQYLDLCNNRRTLTNMITSSLADIKDSVTMPILTVQVPYFKVISGFWDERVDRILEDKVEIVYVPFWEICGEKRLFYSSCLLLLGQATQWWETPVSLLLAGPLQTPSCQHQPFFHNASVGPWPKTSKSNFLTSSSSRKAICVSPATHLWGRIHTRNRSYMSLSAGPFSPSSVFE